MSDPFLDAPDALADDALPVSEPADTEELLERLIDVVTAAKSMPLSSSAIITRDDVLELLEAAREALPDEIHRARRMLREREEFLEKTQRDGDEILEEARVQAERMVQRTEIVRQAEHRARRLLEDAEAEARRMHLDAEDWVDQRLGAFEIVLDRTMKLVKAGRERLAAVPTPEPGEGGGSTLARLRETSDDGDNLFDQDLD